MPESIEWLPVFDAILGPIISAISIVLSAFFIKALMSVKDVSFNTKGLLIGKIISSAFAYIPLTICVPWATFATPSYDFPYWLHRIFAVQFVFSAWSSIALEVCMSVNRLFYICFPMWSLSLPRYVSYAMAAYVLLPATIWTAFSIAPCCIFQFNSTQGKWSYVGSEAIIQLGVGATYSYACLVLTCVLTVGVVIRLVYKRKTQQLLTGSQQNTSKREAKILVAHAISCFYWLSTVLMLLVYQYIPSTRTSVFGAASEIIHYSRCPVDLLVNMLFIREVREVLARLFRGCRQYRSVVGQTPSHGQQS